MTQSKPWRIIDRRTGKCVMLLGDTGQAISGMGCVEHEANKLMGLSVWDGCCVSETCKMPVFSLPEHPYWITK